METKHFEIDSKKSFSESHIWQLNRDYYNKKGIDAWNSGVVPHQLTSNSMVGKTYAELIFGFLKDLANKGQIKETVYILELGAGHGRFAFHVIKHLERLTKQVGLVLPPYCYVISDIVEDNLAFFGEHPQFKIYFEKGILDFAYFDAVESKELNLRYSGKKILTKSLEQPLLALANYFFDSIPKDLFHFQDHKASECQVRLETKEDPTTMDETTLLNNIDMVYNYIPLTTSFYEDSKLNEILEEYRNLVFNTYLFFPNIGLKCIKNLQQLSKEGLMVISMDKGFHEIYHLENAKKPEMITHGSFSFWVNYHAYNAYCEKHGGKTFFPEFSNFNSELGCLLFLEDGDSYTEMQAAYQRVVNDFSPDDYNGLKKFIYKHIARMTLPELIGILRLSAYDSTLFMNILPRLKQVYSPISVNERKRLAQTMRQTYEMHFTLNEASDIAFEIGGIFYALGFYEEALTYFQSSINFFGETADIFYNRALCYYQLRQDDLFTKTLKEAKVAFPDYEKFAHLDKLDLGAA